MKESFYKNLAPAEKYILFCCFFMFALNGLYSMVLGSLLPLISAEYNLSNTLGGTLISSHQAGTLIAGFSAGILPLYIGRKRAFIFLSIFAILGFVMMTLHGNPIWLLLAFLFAGISRGSISNFNNSLVNNISGQSTSALNFLHSTFAVGALTGPFLVIFFVFVAGDFGWKLTALFIAFLLTVGVLLFSRTKSEHLTAEIQREKISYTFLKRKRLWVNICIFFFYLCIEATVNGFIVTYFIEEEILSLANAQALASLLWVVMLIGRLSVAFIGNAIPKKWILLVTTIGTVVFYVFLLQTRTPLWITIAIAGLGLSMAGIYPTLIANVGKTIKDYPQCLGVILLIGGAGAIAMPMVTGGLADRFGIHIGMGAVIVAAALMLVFTLIEIYASRGEQ